MHLWKNFCKNTETNKNTFSTAIAALVPGQIKAIRTVRSKRCNSCMESNYVCQSVAQLLINVINYFSVAFLGISVNFLEVLKGTQGKVQGKSFKEISAFCIFWNT